MSIARMLFRGLTASKAILAGLPADVETLDPVALFRTWFSDAGKSGLMMPEAMCLATSTCDGQPSARMVLMKDIEDDAIVFYTNYGSRKGSELIENPRAAATFHWIPLQRQVRIEGGVSKLSRSESEAYFRTRSRGSRIGAWASRQSQVLDARELLDRRVGDLSREFKEQEVPLPDFWGGFRIQIETIEFWQGRANRLHDRARFMRDAESSVWRCQRLYP